jgi:hypothetical protein
MRLAGFRGLESGIFSHLELSGVTATDETQHFSSISNDMRYNARYPSLGRVHLIVLVMHACSIKHTSISAPSVPRYLPFRPRLYILAALLQPRRDSGETFNNNLPKDHHHYTSRAASHLFIERQVSSLYIEFCPFITRAVVLSREQGRDTPG